MRGLNGAASAGAKLRGFYVTIRHSMVKSTASYKNTEGIEREKPRMEPGKQPIEWATTPNGLQVLNIFTYPFFIVRGILSIDIFKLLNAKLVHFCHPSGSVHSTAHVGCSVECSVEWTDPGG